MTADGFTVVPLFGIDRYATSQDVTEQTNPGFGFAPLSTIMLSNPRYAFLAVGTNYPDALAGGALAGKLAAPLYVVPSNCVPSSVVQDLSTLLITEVVLLGGTGVLTEPVSQLSICPD